MVEAPGAKTRFCDLAATRPLLQVRNLGVCIRVGDHCVRPLKDISFDVRKGETVGLLGESGAGKTTLATAILGLLPVPNYVLEGSVEFDGISLLTLPENDLRKFRGSRISLVYQDSSMLNPVLRAGEQIVEVLRAHFNWTKSRYKDKAISLLQEVEMGDAERIYEAFPHQLSGGQRQRIALAQALACQPALVIADEPTASLDVNTSAEILRLLGRLKRRFQTAFLVISHDHSILTDLADRIMIMYAGRIVEQGARSDVLERPLHPYTCALFKCALPPQTQGIQTAAKCRMPTIAGLAPDPGRTRAGCDFEDRCPDRMNVCSAAIPTEIDTFNRHSVRCFKFGA